MTIRRDPPGAQPAGRRAVGPAQNPEAQHRGRAAHPSPVDGPTVARRPDRAPAGLSSALPDQSSRVTPTAEPPRRTLRPVVRVVDEPAVVGPAPEPTRTMSTAVRAIPARPVATAAPATPETAHRATRGAGREPVARAADRWVGWAAPEPTGPAPEPTDQVGVAPWPHLPAEERPTGPTVEPPAGRWPALPDDSVLWTAAAVAHPDADRLRRLTEEQAGR
jgi:hypothetical protein